MKICTQQRLIYRILTLASVCFMTFACGITPRYAVVSTMIQVPPRHNDKLAQIKRLAVVDLYYERNPEAAERLTNMFSEKIIGRVPFDVVERQQLRRILGELDFQAGNDIGPEARTSIGRLLGATHLYLGMLKPAPDGLEISFRVVEVATGRVVLADTTYARHIARYSDETELLIRAVAQMVCNFVPYQQKVDFKIGAGPRFAVAREYIDRGMFEDAATMYSRIAGENPKDHLAWYNLSVARYLDGEYIQANMAINRALVLRPSEKAYIALYARVKKFDGIKFRRNNAEPAVASAQSTLPVHSSQAAIVPAAGRLAGEHDIAVIVANRNYVAKDIPEVIFAHRDADAMVGVLKKTMGFREDNILIVRDATKGMFETLFGTDGNYRGKLFNYIVPGQSRIFIYYVGHGAPDLTLGDRYFVPVDADIDYIANAGYPLKLFYKNLRNLPAQDIIVVIDACFSGRTAEGLLFKNISPIVVREKKEHSGIIHGAVLTSSDHHQVSTWYTEKQHGLFTFFFLKGMQGAADANADGIITVGEIGDYLVVKVPYMARRLSGKEQTPCVQGDNALVVATLQ